jgi:hypothetical protein
MNKKDLKKLALMGITGGVMMAAHTPVNAHEGLTNISTDNHLAAGCGGRGKCSAVTAYNGSGHSCSASQDPTSYESYPQSQHGCSGQPTYNQNQSGCHSNGCNGRNQSNQWNNNNNSNSQWSNNNNNGQRYYPGYFADNDGQATKDTDSKPLTEADFKAKLSPQARADFDKLSPDAKANAVKMASHDCSGKNDCKGQNACKTDKNSCAGQGGCSGQSKCAVTPEQAVKISSMKDKRTSLNNRPSTSNYR